MLDTAVLVAIGGVLVHIEHRLTKIEQRCKDVLFK